MQQISCLEEQLASKQQAVCDLEAACMAEENQVKAVQVRSSSFGKHDIAGLQEFAAGIATLRLTRM